MQILLIDDDPGQRPEKIRTALQIKNLSHVPVKVHPTSDEASIRTALNESYDLIILDWCFPVGTPQGEDVLMLLRELKYQGPILVYSMGYGQLSEHYIEPGVKADDYYWDSAGTAVLADLIEKLLHRFELKMTADQLPRIEWTKAPPELAYYQSIDAMEEAGCLFHPATMIADLPGTSPSAGDLITRQARELVCLVTTEWGRDASGSIVAKGKMGDVIKAIEKLGGIDIPVLILGETGSGKDLIARLLHYHPANRELGRHDFPTGHADQPTKEDRYLALNCAALPESTLNIELFGSLPGAFTDATEKAGIFEQATKYDKSKTLRAVSGGTVFLDELATMRRSTQAYFLRVLEEKVVRRMGFDEQKAAQAKGGKTKVSIGGRDVSIDSYLFGKIPVRFRLVAATNANLPDMTQKGKFRLDLFYRVSGAVIKLPALRQRSLEDFSLLFQYFFHRYNSEFKRGATLSHAKRDDRQVLSSPSLDLIIYLWSRYPWKGNVRELQSFVRTVLAYADRAGDLGLEHLPEFEW
jgi:DNA-binding NtrC family response regulator